MREMKDSGIEWIGEIPADWELSKIGAVYEERNEKVSDADFPPLSVTKHGVVPQLETAAKTNDGENRKLIRKNDFVINSRSDRRGSCGISEYDGSCSLINTVLKPRRNMCNAYYSFVFRSERFADEFYRWGNGIVDDLWSTKWSNMKRIYIPAPSFQEQSRIADYLDRKCSQIDAIIARQQEVIEKLKAYKLSVITEAVTKGLKPGVPMKDSGVKWIGEIPESWTCIRLKYLLTIKSGDPVPSEIHEGSGLFPAYGGGEKIGYCSDFNTSESSILIGRVGARCGCVTMPTGLAWATDNALIIDTRIQREYMYYILTACNLNRLNASNAQPLITATKIKETIIPLCPNLEEQHKIVGYLSTKCVFIEDSIKGKQLLVDKLNTYKKSIIYEVVTGKKEV